MPPHVRGRSNPKSTTGRLDSFTRVITDRTPRFD
ncbi:MAG: 2'-deoxycytidine 5'-triphosphate deaminase domain-containing protein [Candidatus Rokuibacteriota bacterium]